jgi:hypothetical protein
VHIGAELTTPIVTTGVEIIWYALKIK